MIGETPEGLKGMDEGINFIVTSEGCSMTFITSHSGIVKSSGLLGSLPGIN